MFVFMTFFVWYLALVWQAQLMTSLETSTNALYTQTYWLLGLLCSMEKITHSYKNETKKNVAWVLPP